MSQGILANHRRRAFRSGLGNSLKAKNKMGMLLVCLIIGVYGLDWSTNPSPKDPPSATHVMGDFLQIVTLQHEAADKQTDPNAVERQEQFQAAINHIKSHEGEVIIGANTIRIVLTQRKLCAEMRRTHPVIHNGLIEQTSAMVACDDTTGILAARINRKG